jgi:hypothetical protein
MRARLLLLAALLLAAVSARASEPTAISDGTMALSTDGEIYRVLVGTQGALLPGGPAASAANTVLVLERSPPGEAPQRMLVPDTDDDAVEKYPTLTVDPTTDSVFVVWEARATIHSTLHLAAFSQDGWSSVLELSGDPFSAKLNPRVAATRDSYRLLEADGSVVERTRVVLHLVWFDVGGAGDRALYVPVVIEDGAFVSDWHVLDLGAFFEESSPASAGAELPSSLYEYPVVETSRDGAAAIIAFASPLSGRLATLESRPINAGLVSWSDDARHQIIDTGLTTTGRRAIADKARHQIIDTGRRLLSKDAADLLSMQFLELIADSSDEESLDAVADRARHQIIDTGARLDSAGTRVRASRAKSLVAIGTNGEAGRTAHLGIVEVAASWSAPWLPNRPIRLLPSGYGTDLAVAWEVDGAVKYRLTQGAGWSDVRTLTLGTELTRERAFELIDRRLNRR